MYCITCILVFVVVQNCLQFSHLQDNAYKYHGKGQNRMNRLREASFSDLGERKSFSKSFSMCLSFKLSCFLPTKYIFYAPGCHKSLSPFHLFVIHQSHREHDETLPARKYIILVPVMFTKMMWDNSRGWNIAPLHCLN